MYWGVITSVAVLTLSLHGMSPQGPTDKESCTGVIQASANSSTVQCNIVFCIHEMLDLYNLLHHTDLSAMVVARLESYILILPGAAKVAQS